MTITKLFAVNKLIKPPPLTHPSINLPTHPCMHAIRVYSVDNGRLGGRRVWVCTLGRIRISSDTTTFSFLFFRSALRRVCNRLCCDVMDLMEHTFFLLLFFVSVLCSVSSLWILSAILCVCVCIEWCASVCKGVCICVHYAFFCAHFRETETCVLMENPWCQNDRNSDNRTYTQAHTHIPTLTDTHSLKTNHSFYLQWWRKVDDMKNVFKRIVKSSTAW